MLYLHFSLKNYGIYLERKNFKKINLVTSNVLTIKCFTILVLLCILFKIVLEYIFFNFVLFIISA